MMNDLVSIKQRIVTHAKSLGFCDIGFTDQMVPSTYEHYTHWLDQGHHGNMWYLAEEKRKNLRRDIRQLMPYTQSVWVVALSYHQDKPHPSDIKYARYAWGQDYHVFMRDKLESLAQWAQQTLDATMTWRTFVDTAPVLEKDFAKMAGIGWIGKNSLLMNQKHGSFLYLGLLATSMPIKGDGPTTDHCGSCTACMDACPTQAITAPYKIKGTDCIAYHTIENRHEPIPASVVPQLNDWVAGCDICQEVCPWNNKALVFDQTPETKPTQAITLSAAQVLELSKQEHKTIFTKHALERIPLDKLQSNVRAAKNKLKKSV